MQPVLECVPNFSEGKDLTIIGKITDAIQSVEGIFLLDVDPGKSTNRTVVTFAGPPEAVVEAAFRGIQQATQLIDMSKHKGEHARMGASDVCPLIPISGISMEDAVLWSKKLAERVGNELQLPVYLYEHSASKPERKNLATVRAGEYEGLEKKLSDPEWKPDFGPAVFNPKSGSVIIGARELLLAYNVNLNTKSNRLANSVAFDIRENGRIKTDTGKPNGKPILDAEGNPERIPGMLKACKAVGWYIEEYRLAQVSMNLTDLKTTPLHTAFDACCISAEARGLRVTGSEIVGLVPLNSLLDAGRHYLSKQNRSTGVSDSELIEVAVSTMGLDALAPFTPHEKIIEYKLQSVNGKNLVDKILTGFMDELSSESPAPGGGSVAALCGTLGAALAGMVANLSANKRGWENRVSEFSIAAEKAEQLKKRLLFLVDEDTRSFNKVMEAFALPKNSEEEKKIRKSEIDKANFYAASVPLQVMETCLEVYEVTQQMAQSGNPNSITDAGVSALCLEAGIKGAAYNVRINLSSLPEGENKHLMEQKVKEILETSAIKAKEIQILVEAKIQ